MEAGPRPVMPVLHQERRLQGLGYADRSCRVNAADLAIGAAALCYLATVGAGLMFALRIASQLRVAPPKQQPEAPKAGAPS